MNACKNTAHTHRYRQIQKQNELKKNRAKKTKTKSRKKRLRKKATKKDQDVPTRRAATTSRRQRQKIVPFISFRFVLVLVLVLGSLSLSANISWSAKKMEPQKSRSHRYSNSGFKDLSQIEVISSCAWAFKVNISPTYFYGIISYKVRGTPTKGISPEKHVKTAAEGRGSDICLGPSATATRNEPPPPSSWSSSLSVACQPLERGTSRAEPSWTELARKRLPGGGHSASAMRNATNLLHLPHRRNAGEARRGEEEALRAACGQRKHLMPTRCQIAANSTSPTPKSTKKISRENTHTHRGKRGEHRIRPCVWRKLIWPRA